MNLGLTGLFTVIQFANPASDTLPSRTDSLSALRDSVYEYIREEPEFAQFNLPFFMDGGSVFGFSSQCVYSHARNEEDDSVVYAGFCRDFIGRSAFYVSEKNSSKEKIYTKTIVDWFIDGQINICDVDSLDIDSLDTERNMHHEFQPPENCALSYHGILREFINRKTIKAKT